MLLLTQPFASVSNKRQTLLHYHPHPPQSSNPGRIHLAAVGAWLLSLRATFAFGGERMTSHRNALAACVLINSARSRPFQSSMGLKADSLLSSSSLRIQMVCRLHTTTVSPTSQSPTPSFPKSTAVPFPSTPPPRHRPSFSAASRHRLGGSVTGSYCPDIPPLKVP